VEALLKALDFIDEVIAILRASKTIQEGKQNLMDRFEFDEVQATHIVQMRLGQLTGLEREKLEDELGQLRIKIAEYLELLSSHANILAEVKKEALEVKDAVGDERRTEIVNISGEVDIEDLIPEEDCVFTKTREGYIKRLPVDEYRLQKKGGRGKLGLTTREEDVVDTMFTCSTHAFIMFFTTKGKAYKLKGYEIPEGSRTSKGMNLINILPMDSDEKVSAMLMLPKDEENVYLSMITRQGVIKRTALYDFRNIRKNGIIAINIDEGDVLENVLITHGNDDILVATRNGLGIRFNENDARVLGRTARGVKAVSFKKDDDYVVGAEVIGENETEGRILTVSEDGTGRKSVYDDYRVQSRGGFGSMNYRTEAYGKVAGVEKIYDDEDAILISSAGIIIRLSGADIRECARPAKGVRLIRLGEGDKVIAVTTAKKTPEEPASAIPEGEEESEEDTVTQDPEIEEADAGEGDEE
jgi:DNA gyrase subunit A